MSIICDILISRPYDRRDQEEVEQILGYEGGKVCNLQESYTDHKAGGNGDYMDAEKREGKDQDYEDYVLGNWASLLTPEPHEESWRENIVRILGLEWVDPLGYDKLTEYERVNGLQ